MSEQQIPDINSEWIHHKSGDTYTVTAVTNQNATRADFPITVVYKDTAGNTWSRPLSEWHDSMVKRDNFEGTIYAYQCMANLLLDPSEMDYEQIRKFELWAGPQTLITANFFEIFTLAKEYQLQGVYNKEVITFSEKEYLVTRSSLKNLLDFYIGLSSKVNEVFTEASLVLQMNNKEEMRTFKIIFSSHKHMDRNAYAALYEDYRRSFTSTFW